MTECEVVDAFHRLYYSKHAEIWKKTLWLGVPALKLPFDLWTYQEILWEVRPDFILETGTYQGGSALFLASISDLLGEPKARIVSVDHAPRPGRPVHPRITYLEDSSIAPQVVAKVKELAQGAERPLVILDSDHSRDHVLRELELYAPLVAAGSYLIVEDGNVNGHPVFPEFGPGPTEAVEMFLKTHPEFEVDRSREKFLVSFNPGGYLKRK